MARYLSRHKGVEVDAAVTKVEQADTIVTEGSTQLITSGAVYNGIKGKTDINDIAPAYSSSQTYELGAIVNYSGKIYKCTTAIPTAEEWTAAHWTETTVDAIIGTKQDQLVSGVNIKTINFQSLLGSGNIEVQGGGGSNIVVITNESGSTKHQLTNEEYAALTTPDSSGRYSMLFYIEQNGATYQELATPYYATYYQEIHWYTIRDYGTSSPHVVDYYIETSSQDSSIHYLRDRETALQEDIGAIGMVQRLTTSSMARSYAASAYCVTNAIGAMVPMFNRSTVYHENDLVMIENSDTVDMYRITQTTPGDGSFDWAWFDGPTTMDAYVQSQAGGGGGIEVFSVDVTGVTPVGNVYTVTLTSAEQTQLSACDILQITGIGNVVYNILKVSDQPYFVLDSLSGNNITEINATLSSGDLVITTVSKGIFSGDYNDLSNKPTIPAAQVQADWTESNSSSMAYINHKPSLANVATSGSYNDLSNTPDLTVYMEKTNPAGSGSLSMNRQIGTTIGTKSTTLGDECVASGNFSFATGTSTTASGASSVAEGYYTTASKIASHAEGEFTEATGAMSHVEGNFSAASGECSHAEGNHSTASGALSHAEGLMTIAQTKAQHVFGKYNVADTGGSTTTFGNYVEIVGNGTATDARANARTLDWNGNEELAGNIIAKGGKIGDGNNNTYKLAIPNTTSWTADKTIATTDQIPSSAADVGAVPTTREINGYALSTDITLTATDVGALANTTTYVSTVGGASGAIVTQTAYDPTTNPLATKADIDALPTPMQFKGSVGTGGTVEWASLPAATAANEGYTYKVISDHSTAPICKIGDTIISNGSEWTVIPSGDEPAGTVTSVGLSMPTGFTVGSSPVTTSGTIAVTFTSGYSLPTTTKQSEWDGKLTSPMTTAGDLIVGGSAGAASRLGVGTAGQVLTVNSGATGLEWATPASGGVTSLGGKTGAITLGNGLAIDSNNKLSAGINFLNLL